MVFVMLTATHKGILLAQRIVPVSLVGVFVIGNSLIVSHFLAKVIARHGLLDVVLQALCCCIFERIDLRCFRERKVTTEFVIGKGLVTPACFQIRLRVEHQMQEFFVGFIKNFIHAQFAKNGTKNVDVGLRLVKRIDSLVVQCRIRCRADRIEIYRLVSMRDWKHYICPLRGVSHARVGAHNEIDLLHRLYQIEATRLARKNLSLIHI